MLSSIINIEDHGAKGDGATDCTAAIQAALALANTPGHRNTVYIPPGTFRITQQKTDLRCGVDLDGLSGVTLLGAGPGATRLLMDKDFATNWRGLLRFRNCSQITLRDLTLDGNWEGEDGAEQIHLAELSGANGQNTEHISFQNVHFRNCRGDGLRLQGEAAGVVRYIDISRCSFVNCKRAAITAQRNTADVAIDHCYAENGTDSAFDMEPALAGAALSPKRYTITNSVFRQIGGTASRLISITGLDDLCEDVIFAHNVVTGGGLELRNCGGVRIEGNTFTHRNDRHGRTAVIEVAKSRDVYIGHNRITRPPLAPPGRVLTLASDVVVNQGIIVDKNFLYQHTPADIVWSLAASNIAIIGNHMYYFVNTVNSHYGLIARSTINGTTMRNIDVRANLFHGEVGGGALARAVKIQSNDARVGAVSVTGNGGEGLDVGAEFIGGPTTAGFGEAPTCFGNWWTCASEGYSLGPKTPGLTCVVVGGNMGKRRVLEGTGSPQNVVQGSVGDVFHRTDGTAGALMYVKESGTGTTEGWVPRL